MIFPTQGGDPCYIAGDGAWGTAGLYAKYMKLTMTSPNGEYTLDGNDVFLSCNHVIAELDSKPSGTALVAGSYPGQGIYGTAVLRGFIPLADPKIYVDCAMGINVRPNAAYSGGAIRGIGNVSGVFRNPVSQGEKIRKSGAATSVTAGSTQGRSYIIAQGKGGQSKYFNGIYRTGPGFANHGDSGSIVLAANMDILGMVSWGEDGGATTYFYTFGGQLPLSG